jgi:ribosomal protein L14
MGTRQVEVCDVEVAGVVQSVSRGKRDDGSYVRFHGAQGEVSVMVPDKVLSGGREFQAGDRVTLACDIVSRQTKTGSFTLITAYSVSMGGKPEKGEKVV